MRFATAAAFLFLSSGIHVKANVSNKVVMCHHATDQEVVTIAVAPQAVQAHLDKHGDTMGPCPTRVGCGAVCDLIAGASCDEVEDACVCGKGQMFIMDPVALQTYCGLDYDHDGFEDSIDQCPSIFDTVNDGSACNCDAFGGDSDGDGYCDGEVPHEAPQQKDTCSRLFDSSNNQLSCDGNYLGAPSFKSELTNYFVDVADVSSLVDFSTRRTLRGLQVRGNICIRDEVDAFIKAKSRVLKFPDESPEGWYAYCPPKVGCGNDFSYNGPTATIEDDFLISVFEASDGLLYLGLIGSYSAKNACRIEIRSNTPTFTVASDGDAYPGPEKSCRKGEYPNPTKPTQFVVKDDTGDCYFKGSDPWPYDCFNEGDGAYVRWAWGSGNTDGAVFGPLPDKAFEIALTLKKAEGLVRDGTAAADAFSLKSVGFQAANGYQQLLAITDPTAFEQATFVIRGEAFKNL